MELVECFCYDPDRIWVRDEMLSLRLTMEDAMNTPRLDLLPKTAARVPVAAIAVSSTGSSQPQVRRPAPSVAWNAAQSFPIRSLLRRGNDPHRFQR